MEETEHKRDVLSLVNEKVRPLLEQLHRICTEENIQYVMIMQMFDFPPGEGDGYSITGNLHPDHSASIIYDCYDVAMGTAVAVTMPESGGDTQ